MMVNGGVEEVFIFAEIARVDVTKYRDGYAYRFHVLWIGPHLSQSQIRSYWGSLPRAIVWSAHQFLALTRARV